jgi:hypothetical protein
MPKLKVDKDEAKFLEKTVSHWQRGGLLDEDTARKLKDSYEVTGFDWKRLAQYSFWVAMGCGIVAIASLVINETLLNWLSRLYDTPNIVISMLSFGLAALFYYSGNNRKKKWPERIYSNEALLCLGVLFTACGIAFLGKAFDNGSGHYSMLFLVSVIVYAALAVYYRSHLIWAFALVSLGSWFGTETGYQTDWSHYFLGMNYPMRFVLFGLGLTLLSFLLRGRKKLDTYANLTYIIGYFYLFISLWLLSVFGNFGSIADWLSVKQTDLLIYGVAGILVSAAVMAYGLWKNDVIAREFGVTFLLINIYSRYFEYFWDLTDKSLFFAILGVSFWLIGRKAEKIWNVHLFKDKSGSS